MVSSIGILHTITGYTVYIDGWFAVLSGSLKALTVGDGTMCTGDNWRSVWIVVSHQRTIMLVDHMICICILELHFRSREFISYWVLLFNKENTFL